LFEYTDNSNNDNSSRQQLTAAVDSRQQWTAAAADTGLLDVPDCMNFQKFTHKIYHYPQQQLFTYRVTEGVSATTGNSSGNSSSSPAMFCFKIHTLF